MVKSVTSYLSFAYGEIDPLAHNRYDLKIGKYGAEHIRNFIAHPHGPVRYRQGTRFVNYTRRNRIARLIPFQFNDSQSYLIEATDGYFRFFKDNEAITLPAVAIAGATKANPCVITTSAAHGYSTGDEVFISGVAGMTEINGRSFVITNLTSTTFSLQDNFGTNINSTGYGTYVSGGAAEKIYEITTPYTEAILNEIQFTQNADTMYICHQTVEPRKLTRTGHTAWTLNTFSRTPTDPFTAPNWPRAVCFTDTGRLIYGGTPNKPETIWGSALPSSTGPRFDNFDTSLTPADTASFQFTLAPIMGRADAIQWITNTEKFLVIGTASTVRRMYGASEQEPLTPTSVTAKSASDSGVSSARPMSSGGTLFYIEENGRRLRSMEFDYSRDGYVSSNRNLVADHLTTTGFKEMVAQSGWPNVIWVVRNDGVLLGFSYEAGEEAYGWHRHIFENAKILSVGVMPRTDNYDQLWLIAERTVGGQTHRHVEFVLDEPRYPNKIEFFSQVNNDTSDKERFLNYLYEQQKTAVHLDNSLSYDGSQQTVSITPSDTSGSITITASSGVFDISMIGRQIWNRYNSNGEGGGRAIITAFTSSTIVEAEVLKDFKTDDVIPAGDWFLTATSLSGLWHLEGDEVDIVVDGAYHPPQVVTSGKITLTDAASVIHVGRKYIGLVKTLNLGYGATDGSPQGKLRNISVMKPKFLHTSGVSAGSSTLDTRIKKLQFKNTSDITDRPIPLYTGYYTSHDLGAFEDEKNLYFLQDTPQPCTILGVELEGDTSNG